MLSFGASADYAEAIINTDDPVPSTSLPLGQAVTYDVTAARARARFEPLPGDSLHSWPAAWFGDNCGKLLEATGERPTHALGGGGGGGGLARGSFVAVP